MDAAPPAYSPLSINIPKKSCNYSRYFAALCELLQQKTKYRFTKTKYIYLNTAVGLDLE